MPRRDGDLTGLEPATSAVTGRRANQLRHRALLLSCSASCSRGTPYGIRTRATALKGRRPRPLDEGASRISPGYSQRDDVGSLDSLGYQDPNPQTRLWSERSILLHRAPIAQLVELRTFNPQVPGSSPGGAQEIPGRIWYAEPRDGDTVVAVDAGGVVAVGHGRRAVD